MAYKKTVLIIPPNDAEAVMIRQLADKLGIPVIESKQRHGASLDKGHDYVQDIKKSGYTRVIVVEMPGPKTEQKLRDIGIKLDVIDHHHYTGLSRAHDREGRLLLSSLEQFLKMFRVSDVRLRMWGYEPRLVRGIGIQDRGYIWALKEEGYSKKEIQDVMTFHDSLIAHLRNAKKEAQKERIAVRAWSRRKKWREFWVIDTRSHAQLRPRLSRLVFERLHKPTPLIVVERGRGLIYVQESPYALHLFERFGGFTFGLDRNWGYRNELGHKQVTLADVKRVIEIVAKRK